MTEKLVWIVDDDDSIAWVLEKAFENQVDRLERYPSVEAALLAFEDRTPDVIFTDVRMSGMTGFEFIEELRKRRCSAPV
ncbi:MAG: two-component system nitrogen regulation response regulator GlnG, partial [Parvicella sp.]